MSVLGEVVFVVRHAASGRGTVAVLGGYFASFSALSGVRDRRVPGR